MNAIRCDRPFLPTGAAVLATVLISLTAPASADAARPTETEIQPLPTTETPPLLAQRRVRAPNRERVVGPTPAERAAEAARNMTGRAVRYFIAAQDRSGGWAEQTGPGVTCLVLKALIQHPRVGPDHPAVRRGLEFVFRFQKEAGGIYGGDGLHKNYESSVALSMLAALPRDEYEARIKQLQQFLTDNQWDEGEDIDRDNPFYGGAGYGRGKRPDLSNTQMMIEALHDSGLPKDHPAYQKAMVFIQRSQMLDEANDQPFASGSSQGGFIYSPANGGESKAGVFNTGVNDELRCYGSMTYAGFKSMVFAGLSRDDTRVQAALDWIREHWTLEFNPNMPDAQSLEGLYYYYHVFGRALAAWGEDVIETNEGDRNWRVDLVNALEKRQRANGSWVNEEDRWMEGLPELTTAYSVLALQAAYPTNESD